MPQGKVKWFNNAKGYGFIIEDGCTDDLFAHFSSIQMEGYKTLKAGQLVTFEKKPSNKGVHAVNIVPLEVPQRHEKTTGDEGESESVDNRDDAYQARQRAVNS